MSFTQKVDVRNRNSTDNKVLQDRMNGVMGRMREQVADINSFHKQQLDAQQEVLAVLLPHQANAAMHAHATRALVSACILTHSTIPREPMREVAGTAAHKAAGVTLYECTAVQSLKAKSSCISSSGGVAAGASNGIMESSLHPMPLLEENDEEEEEDTEPNADGAKGSEDDETSSDAKTDAKTACQRLQHNLCTFDSRIVQQTGNLLKQLQMCKEQINRRFIQESKRLATTVEYSYSGVDMLAVKDLSDEIASSSGPLEMELSQAPANVQLDPVSQAMAQAVAYANDVHQAEAEVPAHTSSS